MKKSIAILTIFLGAAIAGTVGYYTGYGNAGQMALSLTYLEDATQLSWQTKILVALEKNDRESAIRLLNQVSETKIANLSGYAQGGDRSFRSEIVEALESAREYRDRTHESTKQLQQVLDKIR